jgi:hypothetical protein
MSLLSTTEQNRSLDLFYGANKGSIASAAHRLCLYVGDPRTTGTELTSTGGYAAVTVTNDGTNWPAASGGSKTSAEQTFPTSTAAWSDVATHWALKDSVTADIADCGPLDGELSVDGAGIIVRRFVTVYYNSIF